MRLSPEGFHVTAQAEAQWRSVNNEPHELACRGQLCFYVNFFRFLMIKTAIFNIQVAY
jgi:hypothetical protein